MTGDKILQKIMAQEVAAHINQSNDDLYNRVFEAGKLLKTRCLGITVQTLWSANEGDSDLFSNNHFQPRYDGAPVIFDFFEAFLCFFSAFTSAAGFLILPNSSS